MKKINFLIILLSLSISGCIFDLSEDSRTGRMTGYSHYLFRSSGNPKIDGNISTKIEVVDTRTNFTSILAGSENSGTSDGVGTSASFSNIGAMAVSEDLQFLWVADGCAIRKVDLITQQVSTVVGVVTTCGDINGFNSSVLFNKINGLVEKNGFLYVSSYIFIRKYNLSTGEATTFAGDSSGGDLDGVGIGAKISPKHMVLNGDYIYFMDSYHKIKKISTIDGTVSTIAGSGNMNSTDGVGTSAKLYVRDYNSMTIDGFGKIYWTETNKVRKLDLETLEVSTILESIQEEDVDGLLSESKMFRPTGIFFNLNGLFISNQYGIRKFN